eukprot:365523-Chlamydomonas_euryale.AAC.10
MLAWSPTRRRGTTRPHILPPHTPPRTHLSKRLTVGRARHANADRARRAVARQPDNAHVVAKVFPAKLRANAGRARHLQNLLLPLEVTERAPVLVAARWQPVQVPGKRMRRAQQGTAGRGCQKGGREPGCLPGGEGMSEKREGAG